MSRILYLAGDDLTKDKMCARLDNWDFQGEIRSADQKSTNSDFSEFIKILGIQLFMEEQNVAPEDIIMSQSVGNLDTLKHATIRMCTEKQTDTSAFRARGGRIMENASYNVVVDKEGKEPLLDIGESMKKCVSGGLSESDREFDESWNDVFDVWC